MKNKKNLLSVDESALSNKIKKEARERANQEYDNVGIEDGCWKPYSKTTLLFNNPRIDITTMNYNEKDGNVHVTLQIFPDNDEDTESIMFLEFSLPIKIDIAISIIKDWTTKFNKVRTVMEGFK